MARTRNDFGEVPIALGAPFPGGYRAALPSRVIRVDLQEYYTIRRGHRRMSRRESHALARERIGGLQSIAAEPHRPRVTLVGHRWDTATTALRRFLARNQISFQWWTPDAPELPTHWRGTCPTGDEGPWYASWMKKYWLLPAHANSQIVSDCKLLRSLLNTMLRYSWAEGQLALRRPYTAPLKGCTQSLLSQKHPVGGRNVIPDRKLSWFPKRNARVTNLLVALCNKRGVLEPKSLSPDPSQVSIRPRGEFLSDGDDVVKAQTVILATGVTWRRLAIERSIGLSGRASIMERREAR